MHIRKYAHSCLLIEENGVKLITDPGSWNETPTDTGVSAIIITHEHQDHCDPEQIKSILERSPEARVITLADVGEKVLAPVGISYEALQEGESTDVNGVSIKSYGRDHAIIYGDTAPCRNSGFLIAGKLFITGDALHDIPDEPVEFLALPTGGPWMRISEAVDYAKKVKPKVVFPVHDAMYIESYRDGLAPRIVGVNLEPHGIPFKNLAPGESIEL
jgi:L-ascorbate metabolism protein UlaG (beta-lactamase superfamily)